MKASMAPLMAAVISRVAAAQDSISTRSNSMIQHARSTLQFCSSLELLPKQSGLVAKLRGLQKWRVCNARCTEKVLEEESESAARVVGDSIVNEVSLLEEEPGALGTDLSVATLEKGFAMSLTGAFEDPNRIKCTWELTKFTKYRKVQSNSVIDAGVKSRKYLEVIPEASSYEGNVVIRQYEGPSMESVARTVAACWTSRPSSKFSKNRCSSHSSDSFFGTSTRNNSICSPAMKDSSMRASLIRKEGIFSNVARLRTRAGVIRPEEGFLPVRFINPGAISGLRVIHETAVVHPDALLGEDVEIGPFCTVGPQVKLGNGCKLQPSCHILGETQMGDNCVILTGAVVGADIPGHTIIGDCNTIGHYAVVGVKCQDMKYKEADECYLYIGDNNDIREFASVHRSSKPDDKTVVGNDNLIMGSCHVAHDCKIGNGNILANGTLLGGHVVVEDLVHTGGGVAVHQFCHIGSYAFLAGGSMVDRDVPLYMMVAGDRAQLRGLNLEGMRRCGFSDHEIKSVRKAYQKLFMNSRNPGGMAERLLELFAQHLFDSLNVEQRDAIVVDRLNTCKNQEQDEDSAAEPAVTSMLQSIRDCFGEKRRGICKFKLWGSV